MFDLYIALIAALLGLVQGISEWLPISSKTQVLFVSSIFLGMGFAQGYALGLFLEGGTVLAAVIYFRREIWQILLVLVGKGTRRDFMMLRCVAIVTIITAIIAVPLYILITATVTGPSLGIPMLILGVLLLVDGLVVKLSQRRSAPTKTVETMGWKDLFCLGVAQGISVLPGVSRSGAAESTLLFLNTKPDEAFRIAFIAGIPVTLGASAVTLLFSPEKLATAVSAITVPGIFIAWAVAILVSIFLIQRLIKFAGSNRITTIVFVLAAIAIAAGIITIITGFKG
jgi:undecaprenyl-diphosphatase